MRQRLRRSAVRAAAAAAILSLGLLVGCQTFERDEATPDDTLGGEGGFSDPAAQEAAYQLDSQLCWDSIASDTSGQDPDALWAACMRRKGWTPH